MYREEDYAAKSAAAEASCVRSGNVLNSFINRVFGWMFTGLAATGAISWYLGTYQMEKVLQYRKLYLFLIIAEFLVVIALSAGIKKFSAMTAALLFMVFALLNGVTLSWIFIAYSPDVIAGTFFATSGTFGIMGLYGYLTKRDLSSMGSLCSMGLIGLIIASLINMSVVIVCENAELSDEFLSAAKDKGINVLKSSLPSFETCVALSKMI